MGYKKEVEFNIEDKLFDEMINRFEKCDNKILIHFKRRALAYITNEIIKKRGLTHLDEWRVIKRELYVKSGVEELTDYIVEHYFDGPYDLKEELTKNLKKRFVSFIVKCYYPKFDSNFVSGKLILDIYAVVSSTNAWNNSTFAFQEEFKTMLTS